MNNTTENICPFCGQAVLGDDPRENCDCVGAREWRERNETYKRMLSAVARIFGENCSEIEPSWLPVSEEMYAFLMECAEKVCFIESAVQITVKIDDSSTAVLVYGKVVRKMSLKREAVD